MQSSSVVQWPSGLRYARRRMNYIMSLQEDTKYRRRMITFLAVYIVCRYYFLLYNPISRIISLIRQYYESNTTLSNIDGICSIIILVIWFYLIRWAIAYVDRRLPPLMRPYVLLIVFLCTILVFVYKIPFGLILEVLVSLYHLPHMHEPPPEIESN